MLFSGFCLIGLMVVTGCGSNRDYSSVADNPDRTGEVGNGGDAVVCKDGSGTIASVELFDYVEARLRYTIDIPTVDLTQEPVVIADKVFDLLMKLDSQRVLRYKKQLATFLKETQFWEGELTQIPDDGNLALPPGCKIEQLAVRDPRAEHNPDLKKFIIRKDLWNLMNNQHKAGLILHEIIYRDFVDNLEEKDSMNARNFHIYLASHKFADMKLDKYIDFFKYNLRIKKFDFTYGGISIWEDFRTGSDESHFIIETAHVAHDSQVSLHGFTFTAKGSDKREEDTEVEFYSSRFPKIVRTTGEITGNLTGCPFVVRLVSVEFYQDGFIRKINGDVFSSNDLETTICLPDKKISFILTGVAEFEKGSLVEGSKILSFKGNLIKSEGKIEFDLPWGEIKLQNGCLDRIAQTSWERFKVGNKMVLFAGQDEDIVFYSGLDVIKSGQLEEEPEFDVFGGTLKFATIYSMFGPETKFHTNGKIAEGSVILNVSTILRQTDDTDRMLEAGSWRLAFDPIGKLIAAEKID